MRIKVYLVVALFLTMPILSSCMGDSADSRTGADFANTKLAGQTIFLYEASDGNDMEIYAADVKGGTSGKLTDNSTADQFPFPTPDGKKLAWACDDGNNFEVCIFDSEGGKTKQLTTGDVDMFPIEWIDGGNRILVSNCGSLESLKTDADCEKSIYDIKTGANRSIRRGALANLPSSLENIYVLSASPASDLLLIGNDDYLIFLDSRSFSVRQLNTQGIKLEPGEWLGREAILLFGQNADSNNTELFIVKRSGQAARFASDAVAYEVCLNEGFARSFTACVEGNLCMESERWEGTPSALVSLEANGNLTLYDVKTGTKKSAVVEVPGNPKILCNGSERIVIAGNGTVNSITKTNLTAEAKTVVDPGRLATALSPDGRFLALTFDSFDGPTDTAGDDPTDTAGTDEAGGGSEQQMPDTLIDTSGSGAEVIAGMPGPALYTVFMTLPDGATTEPVQIMGGETVEFTKDGKYAVAGNLMYDPTSGSVVEMPASLANQMGYGPMGVGLQSEQSGPLVMFDLSSGDSLSLAGDIPIALSGGGGTTLSTSWINLTDEEFETFRQNAGKAREFSPDAQTPKLSFDVASTSYISSGGDSISCAVGNIANCAIEFKLKKRHASPSFAITVVEKGKDTLPAFMSFNQATNCSVDSDSHSKVPGIDKSVITCNVAIDSSEQQIGAYDLAITATDSATGEIITKELHIDIVE